jgi:hypothetical protein
MYRRNDDTPRAGRLLGALLVALGVPAATAGITAAAPAAGTQAPAGANYQIRCWQEGRLLFEENRVTLPADAAQYGIRMAGTDRRNKPIYVADTRNATCLIRSATEAPRWPLQKD